MKPVFLAGLGLFLCLSPLLAEELEIPVSIRADRLVAAEDSDLVMASGSVEVQFKETTVQADRIWLSATNDMATAEGHVRLVGKNYLARADHLTFNAQTKTAFFANFRTILKAPQLKGPIFLKAGTMADEKKIMKSRPGDASTCGEAPPHYHLFARELDYYPGEKIIGKNVTFYVGELPVLWLPLFYYDERRPPRQNWQFGHNEVEGDFVKSTWNYPFGVLLLDYMQKKGWGVGTDTPYTLAALGAGTLYLYTLNERDTGTTDLVTKIDHTVQPNPNMKINLNQRYSSTYLIPSGRIDQTALGFNINYRKDLNWNSSFNTLDDRQGNRGKYDFSFNETVGKVNTGYSNNYEFGKSNPQWLRNAQRFSFRSPFLSSKINFNTTWDYFHNSAGAGDIGEEKIEPVVELSGAESWFSWRLKQNWLMDLREDAHGADYYQYLERRPEIEISPRAVDLKLFNLTSTLGYGQYREIKYVPALGRNRDYQTERYRANLNANKAIPLGWGTTFNIGAGLDQYLYGPGDQLFALRENASLNTSLGGFFRNDLGFTQGYTNGNTPFFFDQIGTRYHDIKEKITFYHKDQFNWSIDGGHNWQTNKYYDVMTRLQLAPDRRWRMNVTTGWDIENTCYKDLVTSLSLVPYSFLALAINFNQNMNVGKLKTGSTLYDLKLMEGQSNEMAIRVSQVYDGTANDFKVRDIMIGKNLHCWEIKFNYNDFRKESAVIFSLKALPDQPLGYTSGRGFYFDGFQKQLNELKGEGMTIRRY